MTNATYREGSNVGSVAINVIVRCEITLVQNFLRLIILTNECFEGGTVMAGLLMMAFGNYVPR